MLFFLFLFFLACNPSLLPLIHIWQCHHMNHSVTTTRHASVYLCPNSKHKNCCSHDNLLSCPPENSTRQCGVAVWIYWPRLTFMVENHCDSEIRVRSISSGILKMWVSVYTAPYYFHFTESVKYDLEAWGNVDRAVKKPLLAIQLFSGHFYPELNK